MKRIVLKHLRLLNFKGVRDFEADFGDPVTTISGRNGLGKTTIMDAFIWLLFGKNSEDKKQFTIKTLDEQGNVIPKLPHEVSAVLDVDGEEITLSHLHKEKWVKKRGTATEEFQGHEDKWLYNEVPCSKGEWAVKIAALCSEDVFKMITNVNAFNSLPWDKQRAILFDMAGEESDEEIAKGNEQFEALLDRLQGKTLDELKREVAAKKKTIKDSIDKIPSRIDEVQRGMPEAYDWSVIETAIEQQGEELKSVRAQLTDASEALKVYQNNKMQLMEQRGKVREQIAQRKEEIRISVQQEHYDKLAKKNRLRIDINRLQSKIDVLEAQISDKEEKVVRCDHNREAMLKEFERVNAETLTIDESQFVCPVCKRPFDESDIAAKRAEMLGNFNETKAAKKMDIRSRGKKNNEDKMALQMEIGKLQAEKKEVVAQREAIEKDTAMQYAGTAPDATDAIADDRQILELEHKDADLTQLIEAPYEGGVNNVELQQQIAHLEYEINKQNNMLKNREIITKATARIAELEHELKEQGQAIADLENIEDCIQQFVKVKVDAITEKINSMFEYTRFKLFEQQINGGLQETCKATVNGVPYADANNAAKINCGLDIINTICDFYGVQAPIFIDNAESVNKLVLMHAQTIRLVVTQGEQLSVI